MTRRRLNLTRHSQKIMLRLHDALAGGTKDFNTDEWQEVLGGGSQVLWELCIEKLKAEGLVSMDITVEKKDVDAFGRPKSYKQNIIALTSAGIHEVESWPDELYYDLVNTQDISDKTTIGIPASDRIVTLNHNQSDYQQAVEALDKVREEFRNDHHLDNELGPQKEAVLKVLEGGRKALEDKEISVENGQDWIVKPLKWIGEKFADGALKVLAAKALELIAKLLGLGN